MLAIKLFGGVSIERDGDVLTGPSTQRHRLALIAMLAAAHPRPQPRERLAAHLWPERTWQSSRKLLNQGVHVVRKQLGEDAIVSIGDELRFEPGRLRCDVIRFRSALEERDYARAVHEYTGPFLDGFYLPGAPQFDHWADRERERLRRSYCGALEALATASRGDPGEALSCWRELADLEPYSARVALGLMEALERSGHRAAALEHARRHAELLEEAFDAGPSPDVAALAERLRTAPVPGMASRRGADVTSPAESAGVGTGAGARVEASGVRAGVESEWSGKRRFPRAGAAAVVTVAAAYGIGSWIAPADVSAPSGGGWPGGERTIAVLPLETISPDAEGVEWFVYAVGEEISDRLATVSALTVRPPETVRRVYGDGDRALGELAAELRVALLLGGSVRVTGNRFRLTVRLIDAEADTALWQGTYDGDFTTGPDIFDAQRDIAEQVASAVGADPTARERARIAARPTRNVHAWNLYRQGLFQEAKLTAESLYRAIELYDAAIDADPGFGRAYARVASAYEQLAQVERWTPVDYVARVTAAAERALAMDSTLAMPHATLAVMEYLTGGLADADRHFRTALRLEPDDPMVRFYYAQFLNVVDRHDEAIAQIRRAQERDPVDPLIAANVAGRYYYARRFDEALAEDRKALQLDPGHWITRWGHGTDLIPVGRYDEAIAELELAMELAGGALDPLPTLGFAYARAGRRADAEGVLSRLRETTASEYVPPTYFATVYAGLGETELALQWLERASEERYPLLVWTLIDPLMDDLRSEPRFDTLMRRSGLDRTGVAEIGSPGR